MRGGGSRFAGGLPGRAVAPENVGEVPELGDLWKTPLDPDLPFLPMPLGESPHLHVSLKRSLDPEKGGSPIFWGNPNEL